MNLSFLLKASLSKRTWFKSPSDVTKPDASFPSASGWNDASMPCSGLLHGLWRVQMLVFPFYFSSSSPCLGPEIAQATMAKKVAPIADVWRTLANRPVLQAKQEDLAQPGIFDHVLPSFLWRGLSVPHGCLQDPWFVSWWCISGCYHWQVKCAWGQGSNGSFRHSILWCHSFLFKWQPSQLVSGVGEEACWQFLMSIGPILLHSFPESAISMSALVKLRMFMAFGKSLLSQLFGHGSRLDILYVSFWNHIIKIQSHLWRDISFSYLSIISEFKKWFKMNLCNICI